ncbi:hypothetical protein KY315_04105, partial [Candidatus Woesearchaeota archaeon]|nr:hypothetical protein [Candidatus Woesearchaeota archaeon]
MINLGEVFGKALTEQGSAEDVEDKYTYTDIIDFLDNCKGIEPSPQQRFILKCIYGLKLDDKVKDIVIWDELKTKKHPPMSEVEFFYYLKSNGRINQDTPEDIEGKNFVEVILVLGRRGAKSWLVGAIEGYETCKLLDLYNPHKHYRIMPGEQIFMRSVARRGSQAKIIYSFAKAFVTTNSFFDPFLVRHAGKQLPSTYLGFRTRYELDMLKVGKQDIVAKDGSVVLTFDGCMAPSLRGPGHYLF